MGNVTLYINPDTQDLEFLDGDIRTVSDADTTAQAVRCTLLSFWGEWELDQRHGTDYKRIFDGQIMDATQIKDIIAAGVYQETEVQTIEEITTNMAGRQLQIGVTAKLKSGGTITVEVSTGG